MQQVIEYGANLLLCFLVDMIIIMRLQPISDSLSVLAHLMMGAACAACRESKKFIKMEGIGVPVAKPGKYINNHPGLQYRCLDDDKLPTTNCQDLLRPSPKLLVRTSIGLR